MTFSMFFQYLDQPIIAIGRKFGQFMLIYNAQRFSTVIQCVYVVLCYSDGNYSLTNRSPASANKVKASYDHT